MVTISFWILFPMCFFAGYGVFTFFCNRFCR
jgi:hypothetical protein